MSKVLVTGSAGWLGNQLVKRLVKEGNDVRCLVYPLANTEELDKLKVEVYPKDITLHSYNAKIMEDIDTVFHLAGVIHPKKAKDFLDVNTYGTSYMLLFSSMFGVKRFIYISSNSMAGTNIEKISFNEYNTSKPYMKYGLSKYLAEQSVRRYSDKMETVIIRPCWFYGINPPQRLIKLFNMIKKGKPIIFGDGNNFRSMTYIDNLIDALLLVKDSKKAKNQTYWIADERPYSTNEIYNTIADLLGVKNFKPRYIPKIVSNGLKEIDRLLQGIGLYNSYIHVGGEMSRDIFCSVAKAKKELGYNPKISLSEGMVKTITWCKQHGKI